MKAWGIVAACLLGFAPQEDADKAAADLLKKVEDRIQNAKSLHIEFESKMSAGPTEYKYTGEIRLGESGGFAFKIKFSYPTMDYETSVRSDGKTTVSSQRALGDLSRWKPEVLARYLRLTSGRANILILYAQSGLTGNTPEEIAEQFTPKEVKSDGKEKLDGVDATLVTYKMEYQRGAPGGVGVKLWIDESTLKILKRVVTIGGQSFEERTARFDIDPSFPADFFELQNAAQLRAAIEGQVARSVALHARYTGRLPKSLEDLKTRPADLPANIFWPESGFWLGGAIPKDLAYSSDATHFTVGSVKEPIPPVSPIGAPTERLKKLFAARVKVHLLRAAGEAYEKTVSVLPQKGEDLVIKPESVKFWPEGGWISGGKLPDDPWGTPFVVRTQDAVSVSISKPKGKIPKMAELTREERKAMDLIAAPPLPEEGVKETRASILKLASEDLEEREAAMKSIRDRGLGALHVVEEALELDQGVEFTARLKMLRDHFRAAKFGWERELKGTWTLASGGERPRNMANEVNSGRKLREVSRAQAGFRSNDRDGNRQIDFWVQDVAGLYALETATGGSADAKPAQEANRVINLIDAPTARADASEDRLEYPALGSTEPEPRLGYYFAVLKNYACLDKVEPYHRGSGRNPNKFGIVAYPAEYGLTGKMTFIICEDDQLWQKDLGGDEIDTYPLNPGDQGWQRVMY